MPQRAASKVDGPQEQRQAVYLIVMFAVRNGGGLALEGREPGGFLGQVYVGGCEGPQTTRIIGLASTLVGSNPGHATTLTYSSTRRL